MPLQAAERRPHVDVEADERRDGVPREPEDEPMRVSPEDERFAGLLRDLPEQTLDPDGCQLLLHEIEVADRHAPAGEEHVGAERRRERLPDHMGLIPHDGQDDRLAARLAHRGGERVGVRVDDLPRSWRLVDLDQLASRREDHDARPLVNGDGRAADGGQHAQIRRAEHAPRRDHDLSRPDVLARPPDVRPASGRHLHHDLAVTLLGVLAAHDGVRALRDDRSREELDGRPRGDRLAHDRAGRLHRDDAEPGRRTRDVRVPDGIAVHGGVGCCRHGTPRHDVLGRDSPERAREHEPLRAEDGGRITDELERLTHRDHGRAIAAGHRTVNRLDTRPLASYAIRSWPPPATARPP